MYDITCQKSFDLVRKWHGELLAMVARLKEDSVVVVIAGTKLDLESGRNVSVEDARAYAQSINALWTETSAKQDKVQGLMRCLAPFAITSSRKEQEEIRQKRSRPLY